MSCTALSSSIEIYDRASIERLVGAWGNLLQRSYDNRIFLTPTWNRVWCEHFDMGETHLLALRDDDDSLRALLPLQIEENDGERVLTLLGDYNVFDYMDALAEKQHAQALLAQLWQHAYDSLRWDRIELRHVPSASPLIPALRSVGEEEGFTAVVEEDEVDPVAILCSSWDGYLQMLSKKQRHEIRRKVRRAENGAEWEWRTARTLADLDRDLPVFFRLHEASGHAKARFLTTEMRAFFRAIAATYLQEGSLRLSFFSRDGIDIATTMSFLYRDRYLLYNSGYDPSYAVHSPGIAAVALTMQDAIADKAAAFDFLSGGEPYKYQFGATNTYTCRVRVTRD